MAYIAPRSLEESGRVDKRYSRQDGQSKGDVLTENKMSLDDV